MKKNVLIGVCAGIASYKVCSVVRGLVKDGHNVKVMMTQDAARFVSPLVFKTLSLNHVYSDMFSHYERDDIVHVSLADWADICLLAPLTANTLSKIASGICDNLLTCVVCALPPKVKVVAALAMNNNMWNNPVIRRNLELLQGFDKYIFVGPEEGDLACGVFGEGRMAGSQEILEVVRKTIV